MKVSDFYYVYTDEEDGDTKIDATTTLIGTGLEMQRFIKKLWKRPEFVFNFKDKPRFNLNKRYALSITYEEEYDYFDVTVMSQETLMNIITTYNVNIVNNRFF